MVRTHMGKAPKLPIAKNSLRVSKPNRDWNQTLVAVEHCGTPEGRYIGINDFPSQGCVVSKGDVM